MKKCFLGLCFLLVACSTSNLLEEINDLSQPSRYFLTDLVNANFHLDAPQPALKGYYPACSNLTNSSELANCACQEKARQNNVPDADNFRALLSTSHRHFACNLQDKEGSYCNYKIRPTRNIHFIMDCPFWERKNCTISSPFAHNLQWLLEQGPLKTIMPPDPFFAGFDISFNTAENCFNFTTESPSQFTHIWNEAGVWQRGGTAVSCNTLAAIFCLDKF